MTKEIAVLGAGSWGTALASTLAAQNYHVRIWARDSEQIAEMKAERENRRYLPGVRLTENVYPEADLEKALDRAEIFLYAVPAQGFRQVFEQTLPYLRPEAILVNAAKGIERGSLLRLSEIVFQSRPEARYVVLSGPSHAEEVGKGLPTTLVAAAGERLLAEEIQDLLMSGSLRIYTSTDIVGVELGGALKNIIALGAGISDGMGYGDNAKAAMMTRGLTEMARLGIASGAQEATFFGLAGIGDLIVTCTSMHSRNRRCGILIGQGLSPAEASAKVGMVVEGMFTTEAAYELARAKGIQMPITEHIYEVIQGRMDAREAVKRLMTRKKKHEREEEFI